MLNILEKKKTNLTQEEAEGFYIEHKGKPFFDALIEFMTSGTIQVQVLEGEDAIIRYRDLMGSTNPKEAEEGTLRREFAESIDANAVHGSDGPDTARSEIEFFFDEDQICPRE